MFLFSIPVENTINYFRNCWQEKMKWLIKNPLCCWQHFCYRYQNQISLRKGIKFQSFTNCYPLSRFTQVEIKWKARYDPLISHSLTIPVKCLTFDRHKFSNSADPKLINTIHNGFFMINCPVLFWFHTVIFTVKTWI